MTDEIQPTTTEVTEATQTTTLDNVEKARQEAIARYKKEETLKAQLEETRKEAAKYKEKLDMYEANGWNTTDLKKPSTPPDSISLLQKQIEEMSNSLKNSEIRREQVEQLSLINEIVSKNDNFELVKAFNAQKTVQELINLRKEKGQFLTETEAAEMIEAHLEKQTEELKNNVSKTKKGKKLLNMESIAATVDKSEKSEQKSSASQTSTTKREPIQAKHVSPWAGNIMASKDNLIKEISTKYSLK